MVDAAQRCNQPALCRCLIHGLLDLEEAEQLVAELKLRKGQTRYAQLSSCSAVDCHVDPIVVLPTSGWQLIDVAFLESLLLIKSSAGLSYPVVSLFGVVHCLAKDHAVLL